MSSGEVLGRYTQYQTSLKQLSPITNKISQADNLYKQGVQQFNIGQFTEALKLWVTALEIYQQLSNERGKDNYHLARQGELKTVQKLGDTYFKLAQYQSAFEFHQHYIKLVSESENRQEIANALARLGDSYRSEKQYEQALIFHEQFLKISQELGQEISTANALSRVAYTYFLAQQYPLALELYQQSLLLRRELGDLSGQAQVLYWLSISYSLHEQDQQAKHFHQQSLAIYQQLIEAANTNNQLREIGASLVDLGENYALLTGKPEPAIDFYQVALEISEKLKESSKVASILSSLGYLHVQTQKYQRAFELHQKSLTLYRELGEENNERSRLLIIGQIYTQQGQYQLAKKLYQDYLSRLEKSREAAEIAEVFFNLGELAEAAQEYEQGIDFYQQSLAKFQQLGQESAQLSPLRKLGDVYIQLKQYETAIDFYQQFLFINQQVYGEKSTADFLGRYVGKVFVQAQQYEQAIEFRQQAVEIFQELEEYQNQAINLKWLGDTYIKNNQHQQAQLAYEQSLAIFQEIKNYEWEAIVLESLGNLFIATQNYQSAREYYQQLITLWQQLGEQGKVISNLKTIGDAFLQQNQEQLAQDFHQQYLALTSQSGDRLAEIAVLNQLGEKYQAHQHYALALLFYQQALSLSEKLQKQPEFANFDLVGVSLGNIGALFMAQEQSELAITFYKAAINSYEKIRTKYSGTELISPSDFTSLFLTKHETDYRILADLLLQQDRLIEAQRVLDLLKVQELDDYLENVRSSENSQLGVNERNSEQLIRETSQNIFAPEILLSQELKQLETIPLTDRSTTQQQRIKELRQAQIELVKKFNQFLASPQIQDQIAQLQKNTGGESFNLTQARSLSDNLARLGQNTVIIYPLILEERLELILVTSDAPPLRRTIAITKTQLNQTILAARQALTNPRRRDFTSLKQLYTWLIAPLEADLAQIQAKTIIYAPDDQLRYIPLAALYDGNQWLAQRFAINHITALSLTELTPSVAPDLPILAGAFTEGRHRILVGELGFSFGGLPFAEVEVNNLATMIPNTTKRLNEEFSKDVIYEMADYKIVHLATHGYFVPGEPKDSFILFGNGEYATLREVENWSLNNVDLVVLSACETGVGDILGNGEEILGFGYQIQRAGAKATIASLWQVSDGGTQMLMNTFYKYLSRGMTKAQAIQAAQKAMITGDLSGSSIPDDSLSFVNTETDVPVANLAHPYYWAAFILIGNGH